MCVRLYRVKGCGARALFVSERKNLPSTSELRYAFQISPFASFFYNRNVRDGIALPQSSIEREILATLEGTG